MLSLSHTIGLFIKKSKKNLDRLVILVVIKYYMYHLCLSNDKNKALKISDSRTCSTKKPLDYRVAHHLDTF